MDSPQVDIMCALELILDTAYHDGTPRDLAVASEAWLLAGYDLGAIDVSHAEGDHQRILARVQSARHGRPRRLLAADARGMLKALTILADNGILPNRDTREANRQRWLARGGHSR